MAKKSLGQNFLLDLNLTARIAGCAGKLNGTNVIEIGPGPGGLTRALVDTGAAHVYAIERDERCVKALEELVTAADGRLTLISGDALEVNYADICPAPRAIAANLPYNIATPLLIGWLEKIDLFDSMTLMFQREVANRLIAKPRTKAYGRLSVMTQWLCDVEKKFDISPEAFTPPPKVTSSVVHLRPRKNRTDTMAFNIMEKITAAAFGQRRKMLRQSLKSIGRDAEALLKSADINPTARAEELTIHDFLKLAEAYKKG